MSVNQSLLQSLPLEFEMEGHSVRLLARDGQRLAIQVSPIDFPATDETKREVIAFLKFLLTQPAGKPLLTFSRFEQIDRRRIPWIARCFNAWKCVNGAKDKQGRLKQAMNCIGVTDATSFTLLGTCARRTKDATGTCPQHRGTEAETLWTYDPFGYFESQVQRIIDTHDQLTSQLASMEQDLEQRERDLET